MASIPHKNHLALIVSCLVVAASSAALGWLRTPRQYRTDPPIMSALEHYRLMPNKISGAPPEVYFAIGKPYELTAYDMSQGKRLYSWFGCASCHGDGRGANGPSFIDGWWIYGPSMVSIVASIHDGRPHGMPSFSDKMTIDEIWQLAGYVKALGAYSPSLSAPQRNDEKHTRPAENRGPAAILFEQGPTDKNVNRGPSP
ncbi:c-type cytochrome [Oryzifoliimicrobium ureilyticus]|uniref:c-type cytochrome n=1 Tax=Oryzifoliimicrobium ureilyticus TaxID=3113724 RepID=UPI0030764F82